VEAVASDTFGMQMVWDRIIVGERIMIAMEGGVEAGNLIGARLWGWCSGASDT
jgi:hypothetical protein